MATQIHFGTSGWRAVMAEEFTFANVRRAVTGIARYVVSQKSSGARVIVGRDPRFLGETFCAMAAEILSAHGIAPLVIAEAAPTPAISYAVIQAKADGAIDGGEMSRIMGKLHESGTDSEARDFVMGELQKPLDLDALVRAVKSPEVAVQVYGASLLAIEAWLRR